MIFVAQALTAQFHMLRLTIQGKPAPQQTAKTMWRRVYRWGAHWGYLDQSAKWDHAWYAEHRTPVGSYTDEKGLVYVLENVTPISASPPTHVDDVWEEEVVCQGAITHGTLWSIVGTAAELEKFIPHELRTRSLRTSEK
jgi:hypothetical protein